jgi:hypothetical protein
MNKVVSKIIESLIGKIIIVIIPTIVFYFGLIFIQQTMIKTIILEHKIAVATTILIIHIISLLCIYESLKNKIKAIKKFRDNESIFLTNRFNNNVKDISEGLNISNKHDKNDDEVYKIYLKNIKEYNKAFEDWGMNDYGNDENTTS